MEEGTDDEEERSVEGQEEDSDDDSIATVVGKEDREEEKEDEKEDVEKVTVVREVKADQEVEIAVMKEEEKEVGGAVGPVGSTDFRTTKVKADRKA